MDTVVARVLDHLGADHTLLARWGGNGLIVAAVSGNTPGPSSGSLSQDLIKDLARVPGWDRIRSMLETLKLAGHLSYLVGGAVRDLILEKIPDDVDILTDAGTEEIKGLFPERTVRHVGKNFGVTLVDGIEVAGCRADPNPDKQARFPENDLALRDLTINSMALDPFSGALVDPFGGRADLAGGHIRFTRKPLERITEDPLRMVRACRFAAELEGTLTKDAFDAIASRHHLLVEGAAPERVQAEVYKAMAMDRPSRFFFPASRYRAAGIDSALPGPVL